jgi:uncharacterized repeat protein (TIGR01451 family)
MAIHVGRNERVLDAIARTALLAALVASAFLPARAASATLTNIAGSPFMIQSAVNSNVVLLSPDETKLFVSNQWSDTITVLSVAPTGALTLVGIYPAGVVGPCGMALNPAGDRLYVTGSYGYQSQVPGGIAVLAVALDGSLPAVVQTLPPPAGRGLFNGVEYLSLVGGDFVYVNANGATNNFVARYQVAADGTLAPVDATITGGAGSPSYNLYAASRLLLTRGSHLYAVNVDGVAAFHVQPDGALQPVAGSPFQYPNALTSSGALASDPTGSYLLAGVGGDVTSTPGPAGQVAHYAIGPDGALTFQGLYSRPAPYAYGCTGIVVDPAGTTVYAGFGADGIWSYRPGQFDEGTAEGVRGASMQMNAAGTLMFAGRANGTQVIVNVYRVGGAAAADLAVSKTGPLEAIVGSNVTYTITVANTGPATADAVVLTEALPAGTSLVSCSASVGTCGTGAVPTVAFGALASGAAATATLVVATSASAPAGTVLSDTATVSSSTADPNPANDASTFSTTLVYGICPLYDPQHAVRSGAVIPIKLALCAADGADLSSSAVTVTAVNLAQASTATTATVEDAGSANPDDAFRFDPTLGTSGGYIFNLSTKGLATGTYVLSFVAGADPEVHAMQFQVK